MSLSSLNVRPSLNNDQPEKVPFKGQSSFDDLELEEILNKPMSALPLGPEDVSGHYSSDEVQEAEAAAAPELTRDEMIARVQKQVNFYYGDRNYPTDKFLRKHTKAHPDGWVPLSVLAIYKKMKKLSQDPNLLAEALAPLDVVELSADRLSVRRRLPPPKDDAATICSTTVVISGFSASYMELSRVLAPYGRIARSRCLQPSDPLPDEVVEICPDPNLLPVALQHRSSMLWLVEYDYADEATTAVNELDGHVGFGVSLLYKKPRKKQVRLGTCPSPTVLMMQGAQRHPRSRTSSPAPGLRASPQPHYSHRGQQPHRNSGRRGQQHQRSSSPRYRDHSVDSAVMLSPYASNPNSQSNSPMMSRRMGADARLAGPSSMQQGHYVPPHQQHQQQQQQYHYPAAQRQGAEANNGWGLSRSRPSSLKGRRTSPPYVSPLVKSHTVDGDASASPHHSANNTIKPVRRNLDFHPAPGHERCASPLRHGPVVSPRPQSPMDSNWRSSKSATPVHNWRREGAASPKPVGMARQPTGPEQSGRGFQRRGQDS
eukprot:TRINITY_DN7355_c0_g2_i1.p1 TRINITY_DN7355_c0_g2~~TRINITY_DN7355_c0_g2_i1.p1  ORF type:complete len:542 (+),score=125.78 TRINITY_DN7355_c0_g2_i1:1189-2814(+)